MKKRECAPGTRLALIDARPSFSQFERGLGEFPLSPLTGAIN
jgi:hypothetical protein